MTKSDFKIALSELADLINGEVSGDGSFVVAGACSIENPIDGRITFAQNPVDVVKLDNEKAQVAVIVSEKIDGISIPLIIHPKPRLGFTHALRHFYPPASANGKIHPSAVVADGSMVHSTAEIGANAVVDDGVVIGEGVIIGAGCFVGQNTLIGDHTRLYPNVTVMHDVTIGSGCIFHPGVVIGGDGFGYEPTAEGNIKMPQIGRVEIGNNVEVGANSTIDRATIDATEVSDDVKVDNLVQIAHNVKIGPHSRIAAQAGISGRAQIGSNVVIAGQAGFNNGVIVGDGSIVGGQAGVTGNVKPGVLVSGYPAREHDKAKKVIAATMRLPKLIERVEKLEKFIAENK